MDDTGTICIVWKNRFIICDTLHVSTSTGEPVHNIKVRSLTPASPIFIAYAGYRFVAYYCVSRLVRDRNLTMENVASKLEMIMKETSLGQFVRTMRSRYRLDARCELVVSTPAASVAIKMSTRGEVLMETARCNGEVYAIKCGSRAALGFLMERTNLTCVDIILAAREACVEDPRCGGEIRVVTCQGEERDARAAIRDYNRLNTTEHRAKVACGRHSCSCQTYELTCNASWEEHLAAYTSYDFGDPQVLESQLKKREEHVQREEERRQREEEERQREQGDEDTSEQPADGRKRKHSDAAEGSSRQS